MPGIRPTKAELTRRIETVVTLVLSGLRPREIWRFVTEKSDWGISERSLSRYLGKANESIALVAEENAERQMALARARLMDLYKRSINIQDYKTSLSVLRESIKLNGLYPAEKHELTGKDGGPIEYTDAKQRLRDRLTQRRAAREDGSGDSGDDE